MAERNPDMEAIDGRTAHRLFMTICQFPAMPGLLAQGDCGRVLGRGQPPPEAVR